MNEITFSKYQEFKIAMDAEIKEAVQGFVNIGYLLKVARDTDILHESGYKSVAEFAKAEYGLTKDVVSRYIRINDRFSENGYSMNLKSGYEHYGIGKLQEMLALPDDITDVLSPQMTREQITQVKMEYTEEQRITDIEVMTEGSIKAQQDLENDMEKVLWQYLKDKKEVFTVVDTMVFNAQTWEEREECLFKALAPKGIENITARIKGVGKMLATITGIEDEVVLVNMRSGEKEHYNWREMVECIRNIWMLGNALSVSSTKQRYFMIFNEEYTEKEIEEVAPVQPKEEENKDTKIVENVEKTECESTFEEDVETDEEVETDMEESEEETADDDMESEDVTEEDKEENVQQCSEEHEPVHEITDARRQQQEALEDKKLVIVHNMESTIGLMKDALNNGTWTSLKMYSQDIQEDVKRIEKIEKEIEELNDMTQGCIQDFLGV